MFLSIYKEYFKAFKNLNVFRSEFKESSIKQFSYLGKLHKVPNSKLIRQILIISVRCLSKNGRYRNPLEYITRLLSKLKPGIGTHIQDFLIAELYRQ